MLVSETNAWVLFICKVSLLFRLKNMALITAVTTSNCSVDFFRFTLKLPIVLCSLTGKSCLVVFIGQSLRLKSLTGKLQLSCRSSATRFLFQWSRSRILSHNSPLLDINFWNSTLEAILFEHRKYFFRCFRLRSCWRSLLRKQGTVISFPWLIIACFCFCSNFKEITTCSQFKPIPLLLRFIRDTCESTREAGGPALPWGWSYTVARGVSKHMFIIYSFCRGNDSLNRNRW